jgi:hypothetical protein
LEDSNLSRISLPGVNFRGGWLNRSDFGHCNLTGANFEGCRLRGTRFDNANLEGANFYASNLDQASFRGANLTNAKFPNASITHTHFEGAIGVIAFNKVGSRQDRLLVVKHDDGLWFKTGCFWGTEEMFIWKVEYKHDGIMNRFRIQYFQCIKKAHKALD